MSLIDEAIVQEIKNLEEQRTTEIWEKQQKWNQDYNQYKEKEGAIVNALRLLGFDDPLDTADISQGGIIPESIIVKFYWKATPESSTICVSVKHEFQSWLVSSEDFVFESKMGKDSLKDAIAKCVGAVYMVWKYPLLLNLKGFGQKKS